ncbi:hypothetical protein FRB94_003379 [Tulasnella sp. JGI-2019a]|nr:hypothetical protein FRB94_003379 [Tulasnella sp. JGI-2019a]
MPPSQPHTSIIQLNSECELWEQLEQANAALRAKDNEIWSLTKFKVAYTVSQQSSHSGSISTMSRGTRTPVLPPVGVKGKDWKLINSMGLDHDKAQYNQIMHGLCQCAAEAGMEEGKQIHAQTHGCLTQYYNVACKRLPMLAQFKNDWVSNEFLKQTLCDCCKYNLKVKEEGGMDAENGEGEEFGSSDD